MSGIKFSMKMLVIVIVIGVLLIGVYVGTYIWMSNHIDNKNDKMTESQVQELDEKSIKDIKIYYQDKEYNLESFVSQVKSGTVFRCDITLGNGETADSISGVVVTSDAVRAWLDGNIVKVSKPREE